MKPCDWGSSLVCPLGSEVAGHRCGTSGFHAVGMWPLEAIEVGGSLGPVTPQLGFRGYVWSFLSTWSGADQVQVYVDVLIICCINKQLEHQGHRKLISSGAANMT